MRNQLILFKTKRARDLQASACEWHHVNMAARELHWKGPAVIGNEQCQKEAAEKWNASGEEKSMYTSWGKLLRYTGACTCYTLGRRRQATCSLREPNGPPFLFTQMKGSHCKRKIHLNEPKQRSAPSCSHKLQTEKTKQTSIEPRPEKSTDQ